MFRLDERMKASLRELGWNLDYGGDHIFLKKPERDTRMTANVVVIEVYDKMYDIYWGLYIPYDDGRRKYLYGSTFSRGVLETTIWLETIIFGELESFLSGVTDIKSRKELYRKYKIK